MSLYVINFLVVFLLLATNTALLLKAAANKKWKDQIVKWGLGFETCKEREILSKCFELTAQ